MVSSDEIERETSRGRGFLSGADRKWLLMSREDFIEEHSRQYWGQRRDKITERLRNAFLDFSLVFEHLGEDERAKVFGRKPGQPIPDPDVRRGVRDALALIYRETKAPEGQGSPFEKLLEHAINLGEAEPGAQLLAPYKVDFEVEKMHDVIDYEVLLDRVEAGNTSSLSEQEMEILLQFLTSTGSVDTETAREEAIRRAETIEGQYHPGRYPANWLPGLDDIPWTEDGNGDANGE